jgi:hypothetical protein
MRTFCTNILLLLSAAAASTQTPERMISFRGEPLGAAIDSLSRWYGISVIYREADVRGQVTRFTCERCSFEQALMGILGNSGLDAVASGRQVIVRERPRHLHADQATIAGIVTDAATGDAVGGASVLLFARVANGPHTLVRFCPTNAFGFFSLRSVPPGSYVLGTRLIGYRDDSLALDVAGALDQRVEMALRQKNIALEEMTVEGERMTGATGSGLARGLFVRSIPGDPNEYILDGARVYNPAHFGGVLSSFHPEALNEIEVGRGGLPPSFGGRIGGMLDLSLRDGMRDRVTGSGGADLLGVHAALEGPIDDQTAFLLTARRGWPDAAIPDLGAHGVPTRLGTAELIAKVSHRISAGARVTVNGYVSADHYTNGTTSGVGILSNDFRWGNSALNIRWSAIASASLFVHASATYTRYAFTLDHDAVLPAISLPRSTYAIDDITLRAQAEHFYDASHTLSGGLEITRHALNGSVSAFTTRIAPFALQSQEAWEMSVYARDRWEIMQDVSTELGFRATTFNARNGTYSGIDPRFSLHVALSPRTQTYASVTSINQFLHPYRRSGIFLVYPTPFWYPSGPTAPPSTSVQFSTGIVRALGGEDVSLAAEAFYRAGSRLHEVRWSDVQATDLTGSIVTGRGTTYGVDIALRKRTGSFTGTMSYTFTHASQSFPDLNSGLPFVPPFSRKHEVHLSAGYVPDEDWLFGILAVLTPTHDTEGDDRVMMSSAPSLDRAAFGLAIGGDLADVNGSRLPGFERLEIHIMRRVSFGGLTGHLSLQLINGYGLLDPVSWEFTPGSDQRLMWRARLQHVDLFPLFPVFGLSVRF